MNESVHAALSELLCNERDIMYHPPPWRCDIAAMNKHRLIIEQRIKELGLTVDPAVLRAYHMNPWVPGNPAFEEHQRARAKAGKPPLPEP